MNRLLISAAILGVAATAQVEQAQAFGDGPYKCFGKSAAGQNDCGHAFGKHSCAGKSMIAFDKGDWEYTKSEAACGCGSFNSPNAVPKLQYCASAKPIGGNNQGTMKDLNTMPVVTQPAVYNTNPAVYTPPKTNAPQKVNTGGFVPY